MSRFLPRWFAFPTPASVPGHSLETPSTSPSPRPHRMINISMGSCNFIFKPSNAACPCVVGRCITQSEGKVDHQVCGDCGHLMMIHNDYVTPSPIPQSSSHPDICPRERTVEKLAALLEECRVVHIRGTPSSGKTILAGLLARYYGDRKEPVVYLDHWKKSEQTGNPREELARHCHAAGYYHVTCDNLLSQNLTFILDEAQSSYHDASLWLGPIKTMSGVSSGPRFCLFSSYGSPDSGSDEYPLGTTPVNFKPAQRVSILVSETPGSPRLSLFYDRDEFEDVTDRLCRRPTMNFKIDMAARSYLYSVTNGHPGAVRSLISYIVDFYHSALKHKDIQQITKELVIRALQDERLVFQRLASYPVARSFPTAKSLTPAAADTLRNVLQHGCIPYNLDDLGTRVCYQMGWLHADHTPRSTFMNPEIICFLPSKLHEKYIEHYLYCSNTVAFPIAQFPSITSLCEAVLRRFSRKNILSSVPRSPTTSGRPPEAQFQDEWYRAFHDVVGHGAGISSEWSRSGDGRIDFWIVNPKWGIELLRDGDSLTEHCQRFSDKGTYSTWISEGLLSDWLILDCRHSRPQKYTVNGTRLWRVVFKQDYSSAHVLNCDNEVIAEEFPLLD